MEQNHRHDVMVNGAAAIAIDDELPIGVSASADLHETMIAPRYVSKLFLWMLIWFGGLLAFIWIIDPYGVSPIHIKLPGINTYKPKRINIDRMIKPYEVWRYQPKTIFLGTSRIHESIDPSVFDHTRFAPAYNAAIPASTLAQNLDNIEQFIKLDPHLKHIFAELFLYNFTGQAQESRQKTWQQFFNDYVSLQMSSDAFTAAIQTIHTNIKHGPVPAHIAKRGHWVPASDFNPATTFADSLYIQTVLSWDRAAKMSLQPSAMASLDRIVALARRHGIELHLLLTPNYPWEDYRLMSLGYWPMLEQWLRKMATYQNVVSFSQYNHLLEETPNLSPKMKWWNDPTHFSLNMGRAMMKAYLGQPEQGMPANLARPLNTDTVESLIAERHAGALHWAATHPDFVKDFEDAKNFSATIEGKLDLDAKTLVVDGRKHPIVFAKDKGIGEVSILSKEGNSFYASGWAVDEMAKRRIRHLIATVGSSVVARGFVTVDREDIGLKYGDAAKRSGFGISIPLTKWDGAAPIRIFALMRDGRAVQLDSQVAQIQGVKALV